MPPTGKSRRTDYVYVMQFEDGTLKHLTKMWNAGWAMKELGWPDLEQPQSKNQPATRDGKRWPGRQGGYAPQRRSWSRGSVVSRGQVPDDCAFAACGGINARLRQCSGMTPDGYCKRQL
jgi:hypothetical protein